MLSYRQSRTPQHNMQQATNPTPCSLNRSQICHMSRNTLHPPQSNIQTCPLSALGFGGFMKTPCTVALPPQLTFTIIALAGCFCAETTSRTLLFGAPSPTPRARLHDWQDRQRPWRNHLLELVLKNRLSMSCVSSSPPDLSETSSTSTSRSPNLRAPVRS